MSKKSKISNKCLEEEISFLRKKIEHFATENEKIKQKIEDLKKTYQFDKDLLKEHYVQITDNDENVRKIINVIELLKIRLNRLESSNKILNEIINNEGDFKEGVSSEINKPNIPMEKDKDNNILNSVKDKNEDKSFSNYSHQQNKLLKDLSNLRNKLDNIYNLILTDCDEEKIFKNYKKINQLNSLDKILKHNKICDKEPNKKELIFLLDGNKNFWELSLEKEITEERLKKGNIKINENKEDNLDNIEEIEVDISINSSFIDEEGENDLNNKFDYSLMNLQENIPTFNQ